MRLRLGGDQYQSHELMSHDKMGMENFNLAGRPVARYIHYQVLGQGRVEFRRNTKLSQFARDIRKVQPLLRLGTRFTIHNGKAACF